MPIRLGEDEPPILDSSKGTEARKRFSPPTPQLSTMWRLAQS
ncbi:hypothetical protein [Pantanalinema sp. GBBB05]